MDCLLHRTEEDIAAKFAGHKAHRALALLVPHQLLERDLRTAALRAEDVAEAALPLDVTIHILFLDCRHRAAEAARDDALHALFFVVQHPVTDPKLDAAAVPARHETMRALFALMVVEALEEHFLAAADAARHDSLPARAIDVKVDIRLPRPHLHAARTRALDPSHHALC